MPRKAKHAPNGNPITLMLEKQQTSIMSKVASLKTEYDNLESAVIALGGHTPSPTTTGDTPATSPAGDIPASK